MGSFLLEDIKRIYEGYLADTERLEKNRSPSDGLLGFGKRPDYDACHDAFAERLEKRIGEAAKSPYSPEIYETLSYIFKAPQENRSNNLAYWMLLAVQKHTELLIPFLLPADAEKLSELYADAYPKSTMLPVQKEIASLLLKQAGKETPRNKHGLSGFFGRKG